MPNVKVVHLCKYRHRTVRVVEVGDHKNTLKALMCSVPDCGYVAPARYIDSIERTDEMPNPVAIRTVQRLLTTVEDLRDELAALHKFNNTLIMQVADLKDEIAKYRESLSMIANVADPTMEKHFGAHTDWISQLREMAETTLERINDETNSE